MSDKIEELCASIPDAPGPEEYDKNIEFRTAICEMVEADEAFAAAVNLKCSRDVVFWFNTFVWTRNPKDFVEEPHRAVILFPMQAKFIRDLDMSVEGGQPLLLEKSREQLASVATANYCLWRFLYKKNGSSLIGSFKASEVDGHSYEKAIFPKIDYTIKYLPDRLLPKGWDRKRPGSCRKSMAFINPETGAVIQGDTCNENFGRGGRFPFIWLDEFAAIKLQELIHKAVGNATNSFLYTTTPRGLEMFAQMVQSGDYSVFRLHWTDNLLWHPKGYKASECRWSEGIWPEDWICGHGCRVHPQGGWPHSERYDHECKKYGYNKVVIAQELDVNYQKSGTTVFDQDKVASAIRFLSEFKPEYRYYKLFFNSKDAGTVSVGDEDFEVKWYQKARHFTVRAVLCEGGPLKVWKEPFSCRDTECVCNGTGLHTYVLGGDSCENIDEDSHCAFIWDATAGEAVAQWHGQGEPRAVAREWAKLCKWYGSSGMDGWSNAFAFVESNQSGHWMNAVLMNLGVYVHVNREESHKNKRKTKRLGVFTSRWNKPFIIENCLQPEISASSPNNPDMPRLVVPFMEFWKECQTFIYIFSTKTEDRPQQARYGTQTRKHHDDRIMAMGHAIYGCVIKLGMIRGHLARGQMARHIKWREEQVVKGEKSRIMLTN